MNTIRNWIARRMAGRYGSDALGNLMCWSALVMLLAAMFTGSGILNTIATVTLLFAWFRILSRNIPKRYEENQKYLAFRNRILGRFQSSRKQMQDKEHCYFRCPSCKQQVRVPKGKGMIEIRCPKCGNRFQKRT